MQIVLITGLSGSGKSIALHTLEDAGYYIVDNLPIALLQQLLALLEAGGYRRVAIAVDIRSGQSVAGLPHYIDTLKQLYPNLLCLYLEARDETLIARFSETRRSHPLVKDGASLEEAIARERGILAPVAERAHRMDTDGLHPSALSNWIKRLVEADAAVDGLMLMFESFGFKYGIPLDANLVFDVRCLPNPYWNKNLRTYSGLDQPIIDFLGGSSEVEKMYADIRDFIAEWLPAYIRESRSYLTVAIGCTGGQHRSVYLAERLAKHFSSSVTTIVRHRSTRRRRNED